MKEWELGKILRMEVWKAQDCWKKRMTGSLLVQREDLLGSFVGLWGAAGRRKSCRYRNWAYKGRRL